MRISNVRPTVLNCGHNFEQAIPSHNTTWPNSFMAGMFKKPKRNFRRKVADSDSDQEKEDASNDNIADEASIKPAPPSSAPEKKTKEKKKRDKGDKSTKLLSFEDDEGMSCTLRFRSKQEACFYFSDG